MNTAGIKNAQNAAASVTRAATRTTNAISDAVVGTISSNKKHNIKLVLWWIMIIASAIGFVFFIRFLINITIDNYNSIPNLKNNLAILKYRLGEKTEKMINSLFSKKTTVFDNRNDIPESESSLINFCVLGCRLGGYSGPSMNGVFIDDELESAESFLPDPIEMSMKAGARLFVFDIYCDADLKPYLVCIDKNGNRLSNNKGSIEKCMNKLAMCIEHGINKDDPIILVLSLKKSSSLFFNDEMNKIQSYRVFSNVARSLTPITKYLLKQSTTGTNVNQISADSLFLRSIAEYQNKIIILSNADTSIYNDTDMKKHNITIGTLRGDYSNLSVLINASIYTNNTNELIHYNMADKSETVSVRANGINYYKNIPSGNIDAVVNETKKEFTIAMDYTLSDDTPTDELLSLLHGQYGVNCIPLDLFYKPDNTNNIQIDPENPDVFLPALTDKWFSTYSYILKPKNLRYTIPDQIPISPPPKAADTKGGLINTPNI